MAPKYDFHTKGSDLVQEFAGSIKDKVILVTGTSPGGIGALYATAVAAASPALIILAGRTTASVEPTAQAVHQANAAVKTKLLAVDLGSFKSVRAAAAEVNSWADVPYIDLLVNNAGIMGGPWRKTEDGFESQFAVNHLGHFLLTNLIMDKVLASKTPRIVNVSSNGHRLGGMRWFDYNFEDGRLYDNWRAYGQSKTANNLFSVALAAKLGRKGLQSYSLSPGAYNSNLGRDLDFASGAALEELRAADEKVGTQYLFEKAVPWSDADQIIATHVLTSFSENLTGLNGKYFAYSNVADQYKDEVYPWATDPIDADRLWDLSEKLVGQEFRY
ncbi:short-chain dehydrogenase/ reductase [Thozetella sp. PMI_491]|nr:short-chain dehydrogenase/ reductase [Thozetella sp. PMI_491]